MLEKTEHRSITMNHFESGGTCDKGCSGLELGTRNDYFVNSSQVLDQSPSPPIWFPDWQDQCVTGTSTESDQPWTIWSATMGVRTCMRLSRISK